MSRGVIKKIVADKGFGFIRPEGWMPGQLDMFFHRSGVADGTAFDGLREGFRVEYEEGNDAKGPRAEQVRAL